MTHLTHIVNYETGELIPAAVLRPRVTTHVRQSANTSILVDSSTPMAVPGMSVTLRTGTSKATYNSQFTVIDVSSVTEQAKDDLIALYNEIITLTPTVTNHAADYGSGETLGPGVYTQAAASSITGTLTLDAGGDPNALFVFYAVGAFATAASSEVILTNGATSSNVWFASEGAASTGAGTILRGSLLANVAAASVGAGTNIEGRMFAITGAAGVNASNFTTPTGTSVLTIGNSLSDFSIFTGTGAVSNAGATTVSLSVGTNSGTVTGFETAVVDGIIYPGTLDVICRFFCAFFIDGIMVADSLRVATRPYSLLGAEFPIIIKSVITTTPAQVVDIRVWSTIGTATVGPNMSFIIEPLTGVKYTDTI